MGAGAKTDPTRIRIEDIARSHHCPLAHMLRKRLHKMGIRTGSDVVFSGDEPVREGSMMLCEEYATRSRTSARSPTCRPSLAATAPRSVIRGDSFGEMPPAAFAAARLGTTCGTDSRQVPPDRVQRHLTRPPAPERRHKRRQRTMPMQSMTDLLSDRPYASYVSEPAEPRRIPIPRPRETTKCATTKKREVQYRTYQCD